MEVPEWLPDWRYLEDYPQSENMRPQHWAWEFLRRNKEYQQAYIDYCEGIFNVGLPDGDTLALVHERFDIKEILPNVTEEELEVYMDFNVGLSIEIHRLYRSVVERFGRIEGQTNAGMSIPCPSTSYSKSEKSPIYSKPGVRFHCATYIENENYRGFSTKSFGIKPHGDYGIEASVFYRKEEHQEWIRGLTELNEIEQTGDNDDLPRIKVAASSENLICEIDVSGNIQGQIDEIKVAALNQQKLLKEQGILEGERRNRINDYTVYLRVFDADQTGFSVGEIATEIFPDLENDYPNYLANKRVRNILTKAKKLVDFEYLLLARL